jgi:rhamnosyl/mannosyltransferase
MVIYKPLMNAFLKDVDRIVVTSPNYMETSEVLKKFENKIKIIPIGLDKKSYPKLKIERISYWKNLFGARFFLFVGVLRYYKGIHVLLEASKDSEIPVVIVGNGPLREKFENYAKQLGLKNVYFVGAISDEDKVALINLCYGIVFPSHLRSEAFGISLLEGAMYGKPMISCEIGTGTSFINKHNITGLVIPPENPEALKKAMYDLWQNPLIAKQMGINAEEHFLKNFTSEEMIKKYSLIYNDLYNKI